MLPDRALTQPSVPSTTLTDFEISLEVADVLDGQGVPPDRASARLVAVAQEVLGQAQEVIAPAALFASYPVRKLEHQEIILENGATLSGPLVARALAGATEVAMAVCTIGPALEERMSDLFGAGDAVRAMALDGAGVAAVKQVAAQVGVRVCDIANARGLSVGMRASPGQEGWSIRQQRVLFGLLPAQKIGVELTSTCLMLPRKSVSFVIGLGPDMRADSVPCDFCSKRERCQWRHKRHDHT
jgi:exosome complex RNA-binding protein Csl4